MRSHQGRPMLVKPSMIPGQASMPGNDCCGMEEICTELSGAAELRYEKDMDRPVRRNPD